MLLIPSKAVHFADSFSREEKCGRGQDESRADNCYTACRLISALRLLHAIGNDMEEDKIDFVVGRWRAVLWGQEEQISTENEKAWRSTVLDICKRIAEKAKMEIQSVQQRARKTKSEDPSWARWMVGNIERLWREQLEVAEAGREPGTWREDVFVVDRLSARG